MLVRTDAFPFERIPAPLLSWYKEHKRDLAWRVDPTPYRVWVSEIMLQQTRVEAVKGYYDRFMKELPTVYDLANVKEEKLLKLWEGLGYYSRARNLQKTAKTVVERFGGVFPEDEKELLKLSGIGAYTAGAIASIAFHKRAPAVDGNVFRVFSRLTCNPTVISEPKYRPYVAETLREVYPPEGQACAEFTQALMELGAIVCKPQSPVCDKCPLAELCESKKANAQTAYPVLPEKKAKREEQVFVFVIETKDGVCVRKRTAGVLKGMYEFPSHVAKVGDTPETVLKEWGVTGFSFRTERKFTHVFTHIRWEMLCFSVVAESAPFERYSREELANEISLPTAFRQCLEIIL